MLQITVPSPSAAASVPLTTLTGHLPGTGGRMRDRPEDFCVDELPLYEPAGEGEHLFLRVEKRGIPTEAVAQALARMLDVPAAAIGHAGLKDAHAVTRQWLSVHTPADPALQTLAAERFRVLDATRHHNKLRPGHLRGNRFSLVVRDLTAPQHAAPILARIAQDGVPNYFGPQRVGVANATARTGRALLKEGRPPSRRNLDRHRFALNAYQAALFNVLVHQRLRALGTLEQMLPGDLAVLHRNGAAFAVQPDTLAEAQTRADQGEISPSAPLFGYRVDLAGGRPGEWELGLLGREGLELQDFRLGSKRVSPRGERRAMRLLPADLRWEWLPDTDGTALRLEFTFPPGAYATAVLRELMKNDVLTLLEAPPGAPATAAPPADSPSLPPDPAEVLP